MNKKLKGVDLEKNKTINNSIPTAETGEFISQHLSFVEAIASKIMRNQKLPPCIDFGDLTSWGIEGLVKAKSRYKESKDTKFETYAFYRIRGEILDCIRREWKYRTPKDFTNKKKKIRDQVADLIADQLDNIDNTITDEEASNQIIEQATVATFLSNDISLAISQSKGMRDPEIDQIDEGFHEIWDEIETLTDDEKQIIDHIYIKGLKQVDLAQHLKCSKAKVSRLHYSLLEKLKNRLQKKKEFI